MLCVCVCLFVFMFVCPCCGGDVCMFEIVSDVLFLYSSDLSTRDINNLYSFKINHKKIIFLNNTF